MERHGTRCYEEKGYAKGGAKMPMRKDPKTGKMIPAFAMDGKGKMEKGGMTKKKRGMAKGGAAMKKKKGVRWSHEEEGLCYGWYDCSSKIRQPLKPKVIIMKG